MPSSRGHRSLVSPPSRSAPPPGRAPHGREGRRNGTSGQDPAFDIHGDGGTGWGSGGTASSAPCGADASGQPWPSRFLGAVAPADGFPRLVMVDGGSRTSTHRWSQVQVQVQENHLDPSDLLLLLES